jgi:peptide subunit release factor 1 (eRF1)
MALVHSTITAASKGGAAALGLADTLRLLEEGRVRHVLLAEGFHGAAYQCLKCGYMTVEAMDRCAFCSGEMRELKDAVNALVSRALHRRVEVTTVADETELEGFGSVAAVLRY